MELHPALATPAPTRLKIRAWLELDGTPKYHVTRFHTMAATSAEITSAWVDTSGGMMPLPTVVATAVPDRAPAKFNTPAISTARPGDSTRVATTVAIALAVSWKPLMKSKTTPRVKIESSRKRSTLSVSSGILQRDIAEDSCHMFAFVSGVLEQLVQIVPAHRFDQLGDLGDPVVQRRNGFGQEVVSFVLEPMDLVRRAPQGLDLTAILEQRDSARDLLRLFENHLGELPCDQGGLIDAIQMNPSGDFLDPVDDVVERGGQVTDVLAIDRRDEGAIEGAKDLMRDLVAGVLDGLQVTCLALDVDIIREQIVQDTRAFERVFRTAIEKIEEPVVLGDQSQSAEHAASQSLV